MVTYSDLFQLCILIVTLIGLCYKIFKDFISSPQIPLPLQPTPSIPHRFLTHRI